MLPSSEFAFGARADRRRPSGVPGEPTAGPHGLARPNPGIAWAAFLFLAAAADTCALLAAALLSGIVDLNRAGFSATEQSAMLVGLVFIAASALRHDYALRRYLAPKAHVKRALAAWLAAIGAAFTLGALPETGANLQGGALRMFFVGGLASVLLGRAMLTHRVSRRAEAGQLTARSVFLVGQEPDIQAFIARYDPARHGMGVIGAAVIRDPSKCLDEDLTLAAATARMLRPDDIFLLLPWTDPDVIATCVDMFRRLPVAIHLGPTLLLDRYDDLRIERTGPISSVNLVSSPLSRSDILCKRMFDLVLGSALLAVLSPLLGLVAIAIKLDSPGPVFFLQRRYGLNQEPFRIVKFRSMSTMEDDRWLRQVTTGDCRVTRVGRLIRRTSIDELPQLFNVLKGDMSLVGPRPHALAHDQMFDRTIPSYGRRHTVRPGMTGWAQVRGWRGETDTPEKMQGRVEHDLYYINNWSIWFDLAILLRTLLSPETFRNAK